MRILALALADESQRFTRSSPPKGARLFLQPNVEILRLAALCRPGDDFRYLDERVDLFERTPDDALCLVHVGFGQQARAREVAHDRAAQERPPVFFGPEVTRWQDSAPAWCARRVVGDITGVWHGLRKDAESGGLKPVYRASGKPGYVVPKQLKLNLEMDTTHQAMQFVRGCFCVQSVRELCPEFIYYGENTLMRTPEEIIGEVISLPRKRIRLLDEDVAAFPDYYYEVFRQLWNYRRQWIVNASDRLFDHPRLIRLLAKAGTRVVYLSESFLLNRLERAISDHRLVHRLYRRVKSLQASKMLVGARITLPAEPDAPVDYDPVAAVLRQIDLDFIEPRFVNPDGSLARVTYRPMVTSGEPAWLKNRFYSMETIADRLVRRPRRVGFFTAAVYLLPYSAAYRQSYLEGIPWP